MKNASLSKKIIFYIIITVLVNVITLLFWFNFKVKPIFSEVSSLREKLAKEEIKNFYINTESLIINLNSIAKMAKDAMASGSPSNTIKEINEKDIIKLYYDVYGA